MKTAAITIEAALDSLWQRTSRGDVQAVRRELDELAARRLTRAQRLRLATVANDTLAADVAHRLLYRTVRGGQARAERPTEAEKLQYGRALIGLDLLTEALEVLGQVNARTQPLVHLALARVYSRQWDYDAMVSPLQAALASPAAAGRDRLLVMFLLANARFTAQGERAEPDRLLREVIAEAHAQAWWDIEMQATQVIVAHHLWDHEWDSARGWLDGAERLLRDHPLGAYALTTEKWRRVLELHTAADPAAAERAMVDLERRCAEAGLHSQVRNCEYYRAMRTGDRMLAARLYHGSPFALFRRRVLRDCHVTVGGMPPYCDFARGPETGAALTLDVTAGEVLDRPRARLKTGQAPHRLLQALVADCYVPANVYELCTRVYPDEYFHPESSPRRMAQLLLRLRAWFAEHRLPLAVREIDGRYHLQARSPVRLRVRAEDAVATQSELGPAGRDATPPAGGLTAGERRYLEMIRARFDARPFGADEFRQLADVSRSTALTVLRALVGAGFVRRAGQGAATRYSVVVD